MADPKKPHPVEPTQPRNPLGRPKPIQSPPHPVDPRRKPR